MATRTATRAVRTTQRRYSTQTTDQYAPWQPAKAITLAALNRFGPAPLEPDALIESAEFTRRDLPHRLLRRVRAHHGLPYLPASNPKLTKVMNIYQRGLAEFEAQPPITCLEENVRFVRKLEKMVDAAAGVIPTLAKGFQESRKYLSSHQINAFLDRAIRNRIAIRLIAEQHLALCFETEKFQRSKSSSSSSSLQTKRSSNIGIVETKLEVNRVIVGVASYVSQLCESTYGQAPDWIVDGEVKAQVCYVGMHMEYILTEILKNAFRATVEHYRTISNSLTPTLTPVTITLSTSSVENGQILTIRIRDCGGGIDPVHLEDVFSYAFTTVKELGQDDEQDDSSSGPYASLPTTSDTQSTLQTGLGTLAGLGYGLPMARTYAKYFGGGLDLVTVHGQSGGVDAFVTLRLGPT